MGLANVKTLLQIGLKGSALVIMALSMMGNKGCEKAPETDGPRTTLRERVMFDEITSSPMNLGAAGQFDFNFVANAQMYNILQMSDKFSVFYGSVNTAAQSGRRTQLPDEELFGTWAFEAGYAPMATYSEVERCMLNRTSVALKGNIRSFEATMGGGLGIGFGPSFGLKLPMELGVKIKSAKLNVGLLAYNPFTRHQIASSEASEKATETNVNFSIDLGGLSLGPSFWFKSELANVTNKAFKLALTYLVGGMSKAEHKWSSRVVADHDTHVVVQGGRDVNMKVGDLLEIRKQDFYQTGSGCENIDVLDKYNEPIALIRIETLGDTIARGKVIEQTDYRVEAGDLVLIRSLAPPEGTTTASLTP